MARIRERARVVGINAMPVGDDQYWPERDPVGYCRYLDTMASLGDWLLDRGYVVRFFPTQLLVDGGVIEQIRQRMRSPAPTERVGSIDELVAAVDGFDFAVATRYHGIVFSLTRLKPVLGIAYQPKSIEVMRQVGLGEYALEMGQLSLQGLQDRFALLERNCGPIAENLRQRLPYLRRELDAQYDQVLVQRSAEVFNAGITPVSRALRLPSRDMENMV